jgi:hypothetical protein
MLMAAATLAYVRDSKKYAERDGNAGILNQVIAAIPAGTRSAGVLRADQATSQAQADVAAGAALLELFG